MIKLFSPARKHLTSAREALDEGQPQEALRRLVYGFGADVGYKPLYTVAVTCLRQIEGEEEAQLFEAALADFRSVDPFHALGRHFIDVERYELAIPFLERAHTLAPNHLDVALNLAQTYTSRFRPQDARDVLQRAGLQHDFWATYEFYWASLLCNQPAGVAEFVRDARGQVADPELNDQLRRNLTFALDKLAEVGARLRAFPDPRSLIQDWHFIQYGAVVLDYFDDRTAEDGLDMAGGRWVALWASPAHIAMILHKLKRLLTALDRLPARVLGMPDRDSDIVARAAALLLEVPFDTVAVDRLAQPHTLLVAVDNRMFGDMALLPVLEEQMLFALSTNWLHRGGVAPDVTGVLSQSFTLPWSGANIRVDPDTREIIHPDPDTRPTEAIARDLVGTEPEDDAHFDDTLAFYQERAQYLKGGERGGKTRLPFHPDSPVPGAYFS